jgi:8-oxo-dGTP diphosphatase
MKDADVTRGEASSGAWTDVPVFGQERSDARLRPGAYGVILDGEERVAVVRNAEGHYLPGGGAEPGETPEETLRREVREECAHAVTVGRRLGEAIEFVFSVPEQRYFKKHGVYFAAVLGAPFPEPPEAHHTLRWLPPGEAVALLSDQSHAWVVQRLATQRP